jgi:endonuclease/exonuclease/phosphatase family metal-dependent hydrolase
MPETLSNPPRKVTEALKALKADLVKKIPAKKEDNILIATWNIREFGDLTEKWEASNNSSPKRDFESLLYIIEIIKCFDIIAVQEVQDNIKCLRDTMNTLGDDWSFLMTDVTKGDKGGGERLAFIFNNNKVKLSGLACEIVVPEEQLKKDISSDALDTQFARTPYAVSFRVKDKTFVLLTLHVLYGNNVQERVPELKAIAKWIYEWAKDLKKWGHSLITLGDFNIERKDDVAYQAFVSNKLYIPEDLENINRTIFNKISFYDQIAWFKNSSSEFQINLDYVKGGVYNFKGKILTDRNYTDSQLSFRISDHLPLWAEFKL